jgi:hypothetical protein
MDLHHRRLRVVVAAGSATAAVIVVSEVVIAAGSVRVDPAAIVAALVDRAKAGAQGRMQARGPMPESSML